MNGFLFSSWGCTWMSACPYKPGLAFSKILRRLAGKDALLSLPSIFCGGDKMTALLDQRQLFTSSGGRCWKWIELGLPGLRSFCRRHSYQVRSEELSSGLSGEGKWCTLSKLKQRTPSGSFNVCHRREAVSGFKVSETGSPRNASSCRECAFPLNEKLGSAIGTSLQTE